MLLDLFLSRNYCEVQLCYWKNFSGKNYIAHPNTQARTKACIIVFYSFNCCAISFLPPLDSEWGSFLWPFQCIVAPSFIIIFIILEKSSVLFHAKMQKEYTILNLIDFQYDVILFQKNNMYLIFRYFQNRH